MEPLSTPPDADAFMRGQRDCMDALPPQEKSISYTRGYSSQYQHQENLANCMRGALKPHEGWK